ncbi:MAG TPA: hypothetical protein VJP82_01710, partial [Sphingomicrobium sp.]|nr:hypothetical protein [Sphingomicrobium sp.]
MRQRRILRAQAAKFRQPIADRQRDAKGLARKLRSRHADGWSKTACPVVRREPSAPPLFKGGMSMKKSAHIAFALLLAAAPASMLVAKPAARADAIAAAVASPDRTPDNVKLDEGRKPAELLKFLGLKPGMRVADPFGGNFY